jgi:hypothetical protein
MPSFRIQVHPLQFAAIRGLMPVTFHKPQSLLKVVNSEDLGEEQEKKSLGTT